MYYLYYTLANVIIEWEISKLECKHNLQLMMLKQQIAIHHI